MMIMSKELSFHRFIAVLLLVISTSQLSTAGSDAVGGVLNKEQTKVEHDAHPPRDVQERSHKYEVIHEKIAAAHGNPVAATTSTATAGTHQHDAKEEILNRPFHESAMSRRLSHGSAAKRANAIMKGVSDFAEKLSAGSSNALDEKEDGHHQSLRSGLRKDSINIESHYLDGEDVERGDDDFQFGDAINANWLFTDYRIRTDCSGQVARRVGENYMCFNLPITFGTPSDEITDDFNFYNNPSYYFVSDELMVSTDAITAESLLDEDFDNRDFPTIDTKRRYYNGKQCRPRQIMELESTQHSEQCEWGVQKRVTKNRIIPHLDTPGVLEMAFPNPFSCFRFIFFYILDNPVIIQGPTLDAQRTRKVLEQHPAMMKIKEHSLELLKDHDMMSKLHEDNGKMQTEDRRFRFSLNPGPFTFSVDYYNVCMFDEKENMYSSFVCDAVSYSCVESFFSDPLCRKFEFSHNLNFANESQICGFQGGTEQSNLVTNNVIRLLVDANGDLITDDGLFPEDDVSIPTDEVIEPR